MSHGSSDTSKAAERVLFELARKAPAWRKVELIGEMRRTVCDLAEDLLVGPRGAEKTMLS